LPIELRKTKKGIGRGQASVSLKMMGRMWDIDLRQIGLEPVSGTRKGNEKEYWMDKMLGVALEEVQD
jgi:hypothetical protein